MQLPETEDRLYAMLREAEMRGYHRGRAEKRSRRRSPQRLPLDTPLAALGLSVRVTNALAEHGTRFVRGGVRTIGDALDVGEDRLVTVPQMSKERVKKVAEALAGAGYELLPYGGRPEGRLQVAGRRSRVCGSLPASGPPAVSPPFYS